MCIRDSNGAASFNLYKKYCLPATNREAVKLPSTSPANAAFSLERLASLDVYKRQQVHTSVLLSDVDIKVFSKLGINLTCEPVYEHKKLYH